MINISGNLRRSAVLFADRIALRCGEESMTYAQLQVAVARLAHGLRALGIGAGDRVALSCPNVIAFPIAYYAILQVGAVVVPLNILLKSGEIAYHLADAGARAFLCFDGGPDLPMAVEGRTAFEQVPSCEQFVVIDGHLDNLDANASPPDRGLTLFSLMDDQPEHFDGVQIDANDTAVILYTSGTTGAPKGAELSHANLAMNCLACAALTRLDSSDVQLVALPLFHTFGQTVQMNATLACGGCLVLLPRFDAKTVLLAMAGQGVTVFCGVPTMYIALLQVPSPFAGGGFEVIARRLRVGISGGAPLPVAVLREFENRFGVIVLEGYGLSETSPVATFNHFDSQRLPGSVGQPIVGVEVAIVDASGAPVPAGVDGQIVVRGHNVMKRYYGRPAETSAAIVNGWFHTGDIGHRDTAGNFFVVDRMKDMIIRGGFNIYPRELEEVLMTHPAVAQVAVLGVAHAVHGEEVRALIVLRAGHATTAEEFVAWCRERMAAYKYPRIVDLVEALPMTATGKILKRALRAPAARD